MRVLIIKTFTNYYDILSKYFNRKKDIKNKLPSQSYKECLIWYIAKRYRISKSRENYQKLSKNILMNARNNDLFGAVKRIKIFAL